MTSEQSSEAANEAAKLTQWAMMYADAGLSVIPCVKQTKRPTLASWSPYQNSIAAEDQIGLWYTRSDPSKMAIAVICGKVSGNLEMIDFDRRGADHDAFMAIVREEIPGIADQLVVEETPSGGYHVVYRFVPGNQPSEHTGVAASIGNQKLAMHVMPVDAGMIDDAGMVEIDGKQWKPRLDRSTGEMSVAIASIETRGEGGYFLCYPTPGYTLKQGLVQKPPTISRSERDQLIEIAARFDQRRSSDPVAPSAADGEQGPVRHELPATIRMATMPLSASGLQPGTDYNLRGDWRSMMASHGWQKVGGTPQNEYWARPGKKDGHSATWSDEKGVFYVFSSNADPFEPDRGYSPFQLVTLMEWNGNYSAAARALAQAGYGEEARKPTEGRIAIDEVVRNLHHISDNADRPTGIVDIVELQDFYQSIGSSLRRSLVDGLLRSGETMNVVAAPKVRKSFLINDLAVCVALGRPWLQRETRQAKVLIIDNELHHETTCYRLGHIIRKHGVQTSDLAGKLFIDNQRGRLRSIDQYMQMLVDQAELPEEDRYGMIIVDAFYRAFPKGTDENDNSAVTALYNMIDRVAMITGASFVLVHHTSKGIQSGKGVTDVGAGAGSQSRAADTHLVLREHKEEGVVVMDAAVRSWPPVKATCLRWNTDHLCWDIDDQTDSTELKSEFAKRDPGRKGTLNATKLDYLLTEVLTEEWQTLKEIQARFDQFFEASEKVIREALKQFEEQGRIERIPGSGRKGDQFRRPPSTQQEAKEEPEPRLSTPLP